MSTIPATNGVLMIAGSQPMLSNAIGKTDPINVPQITTANSVNGMIKNALGANPAGMINSDARNPIAANAPPNNRPTESSRTMTLVKSLTSTCFRDNAVMIKVAL